MDLLSAERLNGRAWKWAKAGAFCCFVLASGLLVATLLLTPQPEPSLRGGETATGSIR